MTVNSTVEETMTASERPGLLYIVNSLNPGGTERLVIDMARAFSGEYRVCVICLDEPGVWAAELRRPGVSVYCLWRQPGLDLSMPAKIARIMREHGTSIVHAHQCTPWFYGALSRLLHRQSRVLLEEHGRFYPEADRPLRRLVNRAVIIPLSHRFVAVSADVRQRLERYEGVDARRIEVIYNGVNSEPVLEDEERQRLRRELGFETEAFVVGTVGRFDPIKNLPLLVESVARACQEERRICGLLVGDGPEFAAIQALVVRLGLSERVRLAGFRGDARRLVQCLDLFVLASFSEGISMALLEAVSAGVPAAVTRVGGNPEVVLAGETGWVVPSEDAAALSSAMVTAARDPMLCGRYAGAGRRRFQELFTFVGMIERYRALYRSLKAAGSPA
jgi:glycosyltransferase involved in cell wall biosynthesis